MRTAVLVILLLSGCGGQLPSIFDQQVSTEPSLDIHPSTARPVPEVPFTLQLQGRWPEHFKAIEPAYPNHITSMVVRNYRHDITRSNGWTRLTVDLEVEAMQEGVHFVPPFTIVLYADDTSETVLRTYPLYLDARLEAAESVEDIRDIKPLWHAPFQIPLAAAIVLALALGILGAAVLVWRRRQNSIEPDATSRLQRVLDQLKTHTTGNLDRDQASELSLALRAWYEQESGIAVAEMTPREIRECIGTNQQHSVWLEPLAALCDRLAFVQFGTADTSHEPVSVWLQAVADLPEIPPQSEQGQAP